MRKKNKGNRILGILMILVFSCTMGLFSSCDAPWRNDSISKGKTVPGGEIGPASGTETPGSGSGQANTETKGQTGGTETPADTGTRNGTADSNTMEGSTGYDNTGTNNAGAGTLPRDAYAIRKLISEMSLDEKIGQLFVVGFKGEAATGEITAMIQKYHIGGIILFKNNIADPDQLLNLTNSLKALNAKNRIPLFLSVDEEGGRISRMPDQLVKLPSGQEVGKINEEKVSYRVGGALSYELKAFGLNMDFAPVLDIFSNPQNTVIGDRAFGTEPDIVSRLGVQTMKGIRDGGVISVVKHFPGHGDTLVDSHKGLPVVEYGRDRLKSFEWKPFQTAIDNGADAVMVAHILMKSLDPENPASMSKVMITDILRGEMGFTGAVATDDMTMGAITENYEIGDAVVRSILAGSDIVLVCHGYANQLNAIHSVKTAIKNGTLAEKRLDESLFRILILKGKYGLKDKRIQSADVKDIKAGMAW